MTSLRKLIAAIFYPINSNSLCLKLKIATSDKYQIFQEATPAQHLDYRNLDRRNCITCQQSDSTAHAELDWLCPWPMAAPALSAQAAGLVAEVGSL